MIGNVSQLLTPRVHFTTCVCVLIVFLFSFTMVSVFFFFFPLLFLSQRHSNLLECCSSLESALPLLVAKSKDPHTHLPFPPSSIFVRSFLILRNLFKYNARFLREKKTMFRKRNVLLLTLFKKVQKMTISYVHIRGKE